MLILTRKQGESLHIGDDIKLTILSVQGKQVKLGLDVPSSMIIYREELYQRVQEENKTARNLNLNDFNEDSQLWEKITIQTKLGPRDINTDSSIFFPKGLIGFEEETSFTLLKINEDTPFLLLQSMNTQDLGLLLVDPYLFVPDFPLQLSPAQQAILEVEGPSDLNVFVTVTIPPNMPSETSINLAGPIFINYKKNIALQVPQDIMQGKVYIADCMKKDSTS